MPLLKNLIGTAVRKVASDPRVRQAAKDVFEEKIKPTAQATWEKAKPEIEEKWEQAKPKMEEAWAKTKPAVAEATKKAASEAGKLANQVKREVQSRAAQKDKQS